MSRGGGHHTGGVAEIRLGFWNLSNLFEAGSKERGPQSVAELDAKLDRIAACARSWFAGQGPDLFAFCEVQNDRLARDLVRRVFGRDESVLFEPGGSPPSADFGIGIGFDAQRTTVSRLWADRTGRGRPRTVLAEVTRNQQRLRLAVCHWPSRMQGPKGALQREIAARELSPRILDAEQKGIGTVVVGDMNAEPQEQVFVQADFAVNSTHRDALKRKATLYGASWRLGAEAGYAEDRGPAYRASRATGSFLEGRGSVAIEKSVGGRPIQFDHVIVSRSLIDGVGPRLKERSLEYAASHPFAALDGLGEWVPVPWQFDGNVGVGASDHLPILVEILIP
ncbi:MAG TPA: hypothetical protein PLH94_01720 [Fimbriimonadaceae bacterium]|nr:hypothetical protein [Fimbriimonadaceae bacterium]